MQPNNFENKPKERDYITFYFIESHLKSLDSSIEVVLDSSHKCFKPLRKIVNKELKDAKNEDYLASVFAVDVKPKEIKSKEIKEVNNSPSFPVKFALKMKKNKFEASSLINLKYDSFKKGLIFESQHKVFKKDVSAPVQMKLSEFDIIKLFYEALEKEKKSVDDPTYTEYFYLAINLIHPMIKFDLILYAMLFIDILKSNQTKFIKSILDHFNINRIKPPLDRNSSANVQEKMQLLFGEQVQVFEKIKRIPNIDPFTYLIKFYTVIISFFATLENYQTCESLMRDLRDNNPFDNLILAKLYLSEYSQIYRNIPISIELKNSLMGKFIYTSIDYKNLVTSFSLISEYLKKDLVNILFVVSDNYEKIDDLCKKANSYLKITDFIEQNPTDDLSKVQNQLEIITQKKLTCNYRAIFFDLNFWDLYLSNNRNPFFWEFFKSNLIIGSLNSSELIESITYLTKFTLKNFIETLDLIVKNYGKIKFICMNEKIQINIKDYIEPNVNDDKEKIKELFSFFVEQKLKDQYEVIYFNPDIWKFHIYNGYQFEFLTFIEQKLNENMLYSRDVLDALDFSSYLRNRAFISMLEILIFNFDKIQAILKNDSKYIDLEKFVVQQPQTDDLKKIYELVTTIVEKEKMNGYLSIKFNEKIWAPYALCETIDTLRLIRKIINECKIMDPSLNEDVIQLPKKIHDVGFIEIQRGTLTGDKLLEFLGEEAFYNNKLINEGIQREINLQNQVNAQLVEIEKLKVLNTNLQNRCNVTESNVVTLEKNSNVLVTRINQLEQEKETLKARIEKLDKRVEKLKWNFESSKL